jgi:6-pyruvoyltetrahydropterin/6-carboxytetrahydropterin synthase
VDHKNLNVEVPFMQGKMCSIENLIMGIWEEINPRLPENIRLHSLKLYETPRIYAEYFGE